MAKKSNSKAVEDLSAEMAKPRVVASVRVEMGVISRFKGMFARVARRLCVSPSMVSRVASGHRSSPKIQAALLEELKVVKQMLDGTS